MLTETIVTAGPPAFPASLRYIENGDALNTGNHQTQAADVAQGLGHLEATKLDTTETRALTFSDVTLSGTNKLKYASRSITRIQPFFFHTVQPTTWDNIATGAASQLADAGDEANCAIRPPHGATLTGVTLYLDGNAGHAGLPGTMPSFEVRSVSTSGTTTLLGSATDASADVTAYQAAHTIVVSGLSHVVDRTTLRYIIRVFGEQGANFVAGLLVAAVACTYTTTAQDED